MLEKRVIVYLDTGAAKGHVLVAKDDDDYVKKINDCANALMGNPRGILGLTTLLCIYKVQNIAAIEFSDPPSQDEKLPIGFRPPSEPNPS
jgi:hypothetical protein